MEARVLNGWELYFNSFLFFTQTKIHKLKFLVETLNPKNNTDS